MDPSYHYQQHHHQTSHQPYQFHQTSLPAPSQHHQPYTQQQPTQSHYLYHPQYDPYYPPTAHTHYPNAYHQEPPPTQEPAAIHPPGVPVQQEHPDQPPFLVGPQHGFQHNSYYPHGVVEQQQQGHQQQWQGSEIGLIPHYSEAQMGQPQPSAAGRGGGRGGNVSFRGRGRGKGRSGITAHPRPPPRMAWCELCRVDCNTSEILEMHKNGKRHKKNLRVQEQLQTLAQKTQEPVPEAAVALNGNVAGPGENNPPLEQAATEENKVPEGKSRGSKRKVKKGGASSKRAKTNDGSSKPTDPPKQKENIPFICELCNVKCESTIVFDSHLKGKKHQFNVQRFHEHQATLGQAALQALYPALQAALHQALAQPNINASTSSGTTGLDQQVLQWLQAFLPQAGGQPAPAPAPALAPAPAPDSALEPQTGEGNEIQGSISGGGSENAAKEGAENQAKAEVTIEELNSESAEPTK